MNQEPKRGGSRLLLAAVACALLAVVAAAYLGTRLLDVASQRDRFATLLATQERGKESSEEQYKRAVVEATRKALHFMREHVDPVAATPLFVFDSTEVPWAALVPMLTYCDNPVKPRLLGGFASADGVVPDLKAVRATESVLRFPRPGRYNLRTNVGDFKVLIEDPDGAPLERASAIGDLIHGNVRLKERSPDYATIQPLQYVQRYMRPDKLLGKFFASDKPLEFLCGQISEFYVFLLREKGFQARSVNIIGPDGKTGHVLTEARVGDDGSWQLLDAYYDLAVLGQDGSPMSVAGLRAALNDKTPVRVVSLGGGGDLSPEQAGEYLSTFDSLSSQYWIYEYDELGQWTKCRKFDSEGEPVD